MTLTAVSDPVLPMHFQLLDSLKVQLDGRRIDLGGLRQQRLPAMLLLDANRRGIPALSRSVGLDSRGDLVASE